MPSSSTTRGLVSGTEQMESFSTCVVYRTRPFIRFLLTNFDTCCSLMTQSPQLLKTCNAQRTCSPLPLRLHNFRLAIKPKKTEVMYHPGPRKAYGDPTVTVNGQKLAAVDKLDKNTCTWLSRCVQGSSRPALPSADCGRWRENAMRRAYS